MKKKRIQIRNIRWPDSQHDLVNETEIQGSTFFFFTKQTNCKTNSIDFFLHKPKKKSFKKKHQNSLFQNLISLWKKWVQRRGGWWWLEEVLLVPCLLNLSNFMLMSPLLTRMCSIPFLFMPPLSFNYVFFFFFLLPDIHEHCLRVLIKKNYVVCLNGKLSIKFGTIPCLFYCWRNENFKEWCLCYVGLIIAN